jgi:hypothetical protein
MRLGNDLASRAARLTFTVCVALAWCWGNTAPTPVTAPAAPSGGHEFDPAQAAEVIHTLAAVYAAMDRDLPRETFDPAAVVQRVGNDPEALFAWTRDRTAYVPYRGALRGAAGVLMDRSGNSLDRVLLLARLLQLAGRTVRLAHGRLDPKAAEALLRAAWDDPNSGPPPAADERRPADDMAELNQLAGRYGLDRADLQRAYQNWRGRAQKRGEDVIGTTTEQSRALAQLVGGPSSDAAAERHRLLEDAADHWWVQVSRGAGWLDLDPSTRDAKAGQHRAEPAGTIELPADGQLPADPALPRHEIELRVRIERSGGGGPPVTEVPLKVVLRPAELAGMPISLQLLPGDWPADLDATGNRDEAVARLKAALLAQQHWAPMVQIGAQTVIQEGFDSHGVVDPKPRFDMAGKAGGSAKGAGQATLDAFGGGGGNAPAAATELTAVWLEYEIRSPGQPSRLIRRDLFDAQGPAARASKAGSMPGIDNAMRLRRAAQLYRRFDVMAVGFVPSPEFVQHLAMQNLIDNAPVLYKALKESAIKPLNQSLRDVARVKLLPAAALSIAASRRGSGAESSALAVDRPNLFVTSDGLSVAPGGELAAREEIDIVANEASARGAAAPADAFARRLAQGVRETVLERYAVGHPRESVNTTALFAASDAQKIAWRKLSTPDDPAISGLALSPDALARIKADLFAGYTVVAPAAPVAVAGQPREGWWRIDPRDGSCVGIGADGAGDDMAEDALTVSSIALEFAGMLRCMMHAREHGELACLVCAVAGVILDILTIGTGRIVVAIVSFDNLLAVHICQAALGEGGE